MSNSFEKSVKGATKIKAAPPKTKYIEHILVATHSGEAGIAEVFRALQYRLRDSTWTVVYKGLITIHLMIREGSPDVALSYIAKHITVLAISNFTDVQTQGRNIRHYCNYLTDRAKAYGKTKTDWVRDGESRLERSTIEKGLLREVEMVQRQLSSLIKCDIVDNEPDNEIGITAFRLLVMDLLSLFQALNQGMIKVLGYFFELSKPDAERAMEIYRTFTKQTDFVVAYLSVARQHEHHTRVEVPKLKHAPVNLGRQLQDYLDDPDFEINRRQYLAEQDGKKRFKTTTAGASSSTEATASKSDFPEPAANNPFPKANGSSTASQSATTASKPTAKGPEPDLIDFFDSIEQNQTIVNPQPSSSFQPPPVQQTPQTGFMQPTGVQPQPTGFMPQLPPLGFSADNSFQVQQTNFLQQPPQAQPQQLQPNFTGAGFGGFTPQGQSNFQPSSLGPIPQDSIASFQTPPQAPPQAQSAGGLLPMPTGQQTTNPFRQSMLMTQQTGMQTPNAQATSSPTQGLQRQSTNPFARSTQSPPLLQTQQQQPQQQQQQPLQMQPQQTMAPSPAPLQPTPTGTNPFARNTQQPTTPSPPVVQQQVPNTLAPQATGVTNPFRQGAFVNHQTGMGWQHNQQPIGGGLDHLQTTPVFPRPAQQTPWQQQQYQQQQ